MTKQLKQTTPLIATLLFLTLIYQTYGLDDLPGYSLSDIESEDWGWQGLLTRRDTPPLYDTPIPKLSIQVIHTSDSICRIRITDQAKSRWEVPGVYVGPWHTGSNMYSLNYTTNPFTIKVIRDGQIVFDTSVGGLVFEDHYLEWSTNLDGHIYGLGERVSSDLALKPNNTYSMFARDHNGAIPNTNLYGVHPFYLNVRESGTHGVFMLNSNAQKVELLNDTKLTWRTIGGIMDIFVMVGPTPLDVSTQYATLIGTPHMPPMWSLGWHQSRWGIKNLEELQSVAKSFDKAGIPFDVLVSDLDYMEFMRDFTFDETRYPSKQFRTFVEQLNDDGRHWVPIFDPGIHQKDGYEPWMNGIADGIFIRNADDDNPAIGICWPGNVAWPDFYHVNSSRYWTDQMSKMHQKVPFSGCWIDMNEPDSFLNGDAGFTPPYNPISDPLNTRTLGMECRHVTSDMIEYEVHSLYGFMETNRTFEALVSIRGTRPFILTRSTFSGSGRFAAHWTGDNKSTWEDMRYSITGIMAMNMFQIPMTGSDICGFGGNTTRELCARWINLGSLYPFSRSHNGLGSLHQEPYAFDDEFSAWSKAGIERRYALLPHLYTLFFDAHQKGVPVFQALLYQFPEDKNVWGISEQFMLGSSLLVSPVLSSGVTSVDAYFPDSIWYDWYDGTIVKGAATRVLDAPLSTMPIHVRGGSIVPLQPCINSPGSILQSRKNPIQLLIAPDIDDHASGKLFWDDGDTIDTIESGLFLLVEYNLANQVVSNEIIVSGAKTGLILDSVKLNGLTSQPVVYVDGKEWQDVVFDGKILLIQSLQFDITQLFEIRWKYPNMS